MDLKFSLNDCFFFGAIISATDPGKYIQQLESFFLILYPFKFEGVCVVFNRINLYCMKKKMDFVSKQISNSVISATSYGYIGSIGRQSILLLHVLILVHNILLFSFSDCACHFQWPESRCRSVCFHFWWKCVKWCCSNSAFRVSYTVLLSYLMLGLVRISDIALTRFTWKQHIDKEYARLMLIHFEGNFIPNWYKMFFNLWCLRYYICDKWDFHLLMLKCLSVSIFDLLKLWLWYGNYCVLLPPTC